jgi:hypothetical protein
MQPYPSPDFCPQCGGYHGAAACPQQPPVNSFGLAERAGPHISGDVEFLFYRPNIVAPNGGQVSKDYEFSPRFIVSFRDVLNLDGRVRWWLYERNTHVLGANSIRLEFSVLDFEATHTFKGSRSQLTLAAGVRLADVKLADLEGEGCGSDMIGLTMAADGLTPVFFTQCGYCGWVYGGRVSLLTGDWDGDENCAYINQQFYNDNTLVTELYAGIELARQVNNVTIRGRALFEYQNWRSDTLAQQAGVESIGLLGPAAQLGIDF